MILQPNSELTFFNLHKEITETYVLKCRLEMIGDAKFIYDVVAKSPVDALEVNPNEATMTWILGYKLTDRVKEYCKTPQQLKERAQRNEEIKNISIREINEFLSLIVESQKEADTHVIVESMKPLQDYDGERNGPLRNDSNHNYRNATTPPDNLLELFVNQKTAVTA